MPAMIIDFHTHIYPDHLAKGTIEDLQKRAGIQAYTDGTLRGLMDSMTMAGIDLSVVCSIATRPEQVSTIHHWLMEIQNPKVHALATMHPDLFESVNQVKDIKKLGFRGFKMHPDYQDFFVDSKKMYPFYEAVQSEDLFILFHSGMDRGLLKPVHATPRMLAKIHDDFKDLRIILAHMGGEDAYEETEKYILGRNVYMDTSFVLRKMPMDLIKRFFQRHPAERFLFATDSPWTEQTEELNFFLSLPFLTRDEKEKITETNAAHLLGL
jgi:predicted TIM-barrel fold metal-dependent hydrolase